MVYVAISILHTISDMFSLGALRNVEKAITYSPMMMATIPPSFGVCIASKTVYERVCDFTRTI